MAKIQVLGTGCSKCGYLLKNAEAVVEERQAGDTVEKVDDIMEVLEFNPSALPALAIDGKVVSVGTVPSPTEIHQLIDQSNQRENL
ncbi:redox-active disulfide protein 2 [Rhodopirellula islandica]|uniref:Redox-active disulfide protein 2 n=1 Tax=Rhodopirellula islandica TaxID=595434 RepID=A0A0J1BM46_RHOIS|nr:thioredoxin family protein [Rhodopirellula islandica]KLU07547.1 redox-active disulfide protein 2 [Rhodopirellula islandica]